MIHYALFFFYEKKGVPRKTYRTEVVLKIEIENFYLQNNFGPKKSFQRAHFERSEKQFLVNLFMHSYRFIG